MNALKKANDISSTLFKTGDLSVAFKLKPQLPDSKSSTGLKPIVEQVNLYIDGVEEPYRMGSPFWKDYNWPGSKGTPGARLNISMRNLGTDSKNYNGEWAFFKLLNDASISRGESSSMYNLNWFFAKNNYDITVSYLLNAGSSRNPFSKNFFTSFNLPGKIN
jgi:type VI secretion system protein ImpL